MNTPSYGLQNPLQDMNPLNIIAQRAPTGNDIGYPIGQIWVYSSSNQSYQLTSTSSGSAVWSILGPGSSEVDTLTGNTGGAISPSGGTIHIVGGNLLSVAGSGSTLTINQTSGAYPISSYVVGPSGKAGYQTVQSAIDAAGSVSGGASIYIMPGTYTENLDFSSVTVDLELIGAAGTVSAGNVIISGLSNLPTASLNLSFTNIVFVSGTHAFSQAGAGACGVSFFNCGFNLTAGYIVNTASFASNSYVFQNCTDSSTASGIVNTGASTVVMRSSQLGAGSSQTGASSGALTILNCTVVCPYTLTGSASTNNIVASTFQGDLTLGGSSAGFIEGCAFETGSATALTMSSSGNYSLTSSVINTSANPAIAGSGAGTLYLGEVSFISGGNISASLTTVVLSMGSTGNVTASSSIAGASKTMAVTNTSTAASSNAGTVMTVAGTAAGDPYTSYVITSGATWTVGADNSASDAYVIAASSALGTTNIISAATTGAVTVALGDLSVTSAAAGAARTVAVSNTDNTAGANAVFSSTVGGTSAGDPQASFIVTGGSTWSIGADNSTSDAFTISASAALGTSNAAQWSTSGALLNAGNIATTNGSLTLGTAGNKILITTGANASIGTSVAMTAGSVTISTTAVTSSSIIFVSRNTVGGTTGNLSTPSASIVNNTSFVINSSSGSDTSTVNWWIIN